MNDIDRVTQRLIGAAISVHRELGPGLLESVYEECLVDELKDCGLQVQSQVYVPIVFKGRKLQKDFRIDILVEDLIVIEVKAAECFNPVYKAQLITYLKLGDFPTGYILNFNVTLMKDGIYRCFRDASTTIKNQR